MLVDLSKEKVSSLVSERRNFLLVGWHRFEELAATMKSHGFRGNLPSSQKKIKAGRLRQYDLSTQDGVKACMMLVRMADDAIMVTFPGTLQNQHDSSF